MTKPLEALVSGAVVGSYYLAKCDNCEEMFSSGKMTGGEPLYSGDYGDSYCPHCGVDDSEVSDYGNEALEAWNFQQKYIDALIAALEQSQREKDKWVKFATELGGKCDRLEASKLAVKLPGVGGVENTTTQSIRDYADGWRAYREEAIKMLAAAGITVQGDE